MSNNNTFIVVTWPESQELMDMDGFEDNCYLINDDKGLYEFGSSAYFVRKSWLPNMDIEDIMEAVEDYLKEEKPIVFNENKALKWLKATDLNKASKKLFLNNVKNRIEAAKV